MTSSDDLPTLTYSERLTEWENLFERVQDIKEVDEIKKEFRKLKGSILNKHEITPEDDKKILNIIRTQWNWIIRDTADSALKNIDERKTKGQTYSKIIKEINDLKMKGQKEYDDLIEYEDIYAELDELSNEVKENISNEEYAHKQNWKFTVINIAIGAVIGFIISILTALLLKQYGIC
jgi:tetrahydromethanopterin S-methyltransferase subunit G